MSERMIAPYVKRVEEQGGSTSRVLRIVWPKNQSFSSICDKYVEYVQSKYQPQAVVVFYGYPDDVQGGTKTAERMRRSRKHASTDILFDDTMVPAMSKEKLLANPKKKNKGRLVSMMIEKFSSPYITCKQAKEDTGTLIVNTALSLAPSNETVIVVGEHVNLLVTLTGLCRAENVFFLKPGKDNVTATTSYPTNAMSSPVAENILLLHAMSGCDTSALFMQRKMKFLKTLEKNPHILLMLNSNIAALPPSAAAARQHTLRVYHQVQQWLGVEKNAEEWGWKKTNTGLEPVFTVLPPALPALLKLKAGLCCSNMCLNCEGNCNNIAVVSQGEEDELALKTELETDCSPIEPMDPIEEE
ncbi:hypothetical protein PR048_002674 [Dryococelus australis]|uniref:Uncharacterized protein n=1 Tax=Dryococelus australis TaxID=614101 RepID=A0ABQ9IKV1_9NEOP|nr:hypothetical protein PR048_002674 [Dryococelus australis]